MKKTSIFALVSSIICVAICIWFNSICGLIGTLHWHKDILAIDIVLIVTVFFPAIFFFINKLKTNKATTVLSYIFSVFSTVLWVGILCFLLISTSVKIDNSGLNIISTSEELPINQNHQWDEPIARYAFASDPHWGAGSSNSEARIDIMKSIENENYDGFFLLGDIAEFGVISSFFQEAVDDLSTYMPTTKKRVMPGNHDAIVYGLREFKSVFMEENDEFYYRLDNGKIHFLFLNMLWDTSEFTKKQEKWLISQLEEIPQDDTVVVLSHCYITGSGYWDEIAGKHWGDIPDVVDKLCPILEKYNVDLSLSGHNHFFECLEKDNVDYVILGAMGGVLDDDLIYSSPYSKWLNNTDFGWLDMKVYENYLELTVYNQYGKELHRKTVKTK